MAGLSIRRVITQQVRSSTLVEATVAIIIIAMVFAIATFVYLNVYRSGMSTKKLRASLALQDIWVKTLKDETFVEENIVWEDMTIHKNVVVHPDKPELFSVRFEMRDENGKIIAERKALVHRPK